MTRTKKSSTKTKKVRRTPPRSKATSKSTKSAKIPHATVDPDMVNHETYKKLMRKGMSDSQARAFARHAGGGVGGKSKGGKSSKPVTKKVTRVAGKQNLR